MIKKLINPIASELYKTFCENPKTHACSIRTDLSRHIEHLATLKEDEDPEYVKMIQDYIAMYKAKIEVYPLLSYVNFYWILSHFIDVPRYAQ